MHDARLGLVFIDGGRDRDTRAVRRDERAAIAGLASTCRVEDGSVRDQSTRFGDTDDVCLQRLEIGILAEKRLGHWIIPANVEP